MRIEFVTENSIRKYQVLWPVAPLKIKQLQQCSCFFFAKNQQKKPQKPLRVNQDANKKQMATTVNRWNAVFDWAVHEMMRFVDSMQFFLDLSIKRA